MLNSKLINQLSIIQLIVATSSVQEYQAPATNMGCANGPTNCQNQW